MLTITIQNPRTNGSRAPSYEAVLDGVVLCRSQNPTMAAARVLIAQGHDPETLMTSRHVGLPHATWVPAPIRHFAHWTVNEGENRMHRSKWEGYPED